jgi:hypothetical protein
MPRNHTLPTCCSLGTARNESALRFTSCQLPISPASNFLRSGSVNQAGPEARRLHCSSQMLPSYRAHRRTGSWVGEVPAAQALQACISSAGSMLVTQGQRLSSLGRRGHTGLEWTRIASGVRLRGLLRGL